MMRPRLLSKRLLIQSRCITVKSRAGLRLLQHRHLESDSGGNLTSYDTAENLQEDLRDEFLGWKTLPGSLQTDIPTPRPKLITFESTPTFTLGRRQDDIFPAQRARLERPLGVNLLQRREPIRNATTGPQVRKTNRGGLTTYHGPGQLAFWPVLDMHSPLYPKFGVATYANHLESTTQRLLTKAFGVKTYTSPEEPGVWVTTTDGKERKIAALGVHHRRHITALGIALNVDIPVVGDEDVNPWARFVPCGLEGKLVTSVAAETKKGPDFWDLKDLAGQWAELFEEGLLDVSKRTFGDQG